MKDFNGKRVHPPVMREMLSALPMQVDGLEWVSWAQAMLSRTSPVAYEELSKQDQKRVVRGFAAFRHILRTVIGPGLNPVLISGSTEYEDQSVTRRYVLAEDGKSFVIQYDLKDEDFPIGLYPKSEKVSRENYQAQYYRPGDHGSIVTSTAKVFENDQPLDLDKALDPISHLFDEKEMLARGIMAAMNAPVIEKDYEVYYEHPGYKGLNDTSERVVYNLITGRLCILKDVIKRSPGCFNGVILMQHRSNKINYAKSTDVPLSMLDMVEDRSAEDEKPNRRPLLDSFPPRRPEWVQEVPKFEPLEYIQLDASDCEEIKDLLEAVATLDEAYDRQRLNSIVLKHYGIG